MKYVQKADSYKRLWSSIMNRREYTSTNEWGCHELAARFYEVVLLSKQLLSSKGFNHTSHKQIRESLKDVDKRLAVLYKLLFDASREIRYEKIRVSKQYRKEFIDNYSKALKILEKILK